MWSRILPHRIFDHAALLIRTRRAATISAGALLPSSLQGPPQSVLAQPGDCQLGPDWTAVPLLERIPVSSTSAVLRFATPDRTRPLQLSTCACLLARAVVREDGAAAEQEPEAIVRPYTPISTNAQVGHFDLLIKNYGVRLSRHLVQDIQPGDTVEFKHVEANVKIQAHELFPYDRICMCVGGTGITPMIQALHALLGPTSTTVNNARAPQVTMLYGSKTSDDILGQELLDQWAKDYPDQFQLVHILSDEPESSDWKGERGLIDRARIKQYFPKASDSTKTLIFVCGPPPMYAALSGPRDDKEQVLGVLGEMGYTTEQVYKF